MPAYRVEWAIDVEAATPREAAEKARAMQQYPRPDYWCGVFDVFEIDPALNQDYGAAIRVDLDEPASSEDSE